MDWSIVISRQKAALLAVVERMRTMAGGVISPLCGGDKDAAPFIPRLLTLAILRLLRPAESAARRLIVIVAAGLKDRVRSASEGNGKPNRPLPDFSSFAKTQSPRPPAFRLFDTPWVMVPRAFGQGRRAVPRVSFLGWDRAAAPLSPLAGEMSPKATEGGKVTAKAPPSVCCADISPARGESGALHRRISALHFALNTLPAQARRLKRIMAAREKSVAEKAAKGLAPGSTKNPLPLGPIRPGRPPGHIAKPRNEADLILKDCQDLALYRIRVPQPPP